MHSILFLNSVFSGQIFARKTCVYDELVCVGLMLSSLFQMGGEYYLTHLRVSKLLQNKII